MNELAVRSGLHPTQTAQGKKQALGGMPETFANHCGQQGKAVTLDATQAERKRTTQAKGSAANHC